MGHLPHARVYIGRVTDRAEILAALERAERELDAGGSLAGTGFWKAVGTIKRRPELVDEYADRIAELDRRAFEDWPMILVPEPMGTVLALGAAVVGGGAVAVAGRLPDPWDFVLFGGGGVALFASTHGLGHTVVGRLLGMSFTHWFVPAITRPQPGVKVDYASYLRSSPRRRAWMHAAGAIATKLLPVALIPVARSHDLPRWLTWGLVGVAVGQVATDIVWSTKASDWKKFRRELRYS